MQATPAIAALIDPFTAVQGGASGVGALSGLGAPSADPANDAGDQTAADGGQFGDALAAAMAAALGAPPPAQPVAATASTAQGDGAEQVASGRRQGSSAVFAPMILQATKAMTSDAAATAVAGASDLASAKSPDLEMGAAQAVAAPAATQTATPTLAAAPSKAQAATQQIAAADLSAAQAGVSAPNSPETVSAQAKIPATAPLRASVSAAPQAPSLAPTAPQVTAQTTPQTDGLEPVHAEATVRDTVMAQAPAQLSAQAPAQALAQSDPRSSGQADAGSPAAPVVAATTANLSSSTPSPVVTPASATVEPATPVAAMPAPIQVAQAATQASAAPVKPAAAGAESSGRSARTKAAGSAAPIDLRNAASAPTKPEAQAQVMAKAPTDLPGSTADDQSTPAEADIEPPAVAAASIGAADHAALHPAPVETPRATPQTVALLAGQIVSKVDGKSTRFDVQLDPHGLGKVDVRVEISARGDISAALTFENPHTASELRGKAGELHTALEQAGFDLSKTSLSFSSGGQGQPQQGLFDQQQSQTPVWRGRAFTDLSDTPEAAPAPVQRRAAAGGVDVRI